MDKVSPEVRSRMMRQIKSRDTQPELIVRRQLHAMGYRFKTCCTSLPGKPDICFSARKVAVFVDGDFWHRCPDHTHKKGVQSNVDFWEDKFAKNVARDARNNARLEEMGWRVIRIWECQVNDRGTILKAVSLIGPTRWRDPSAGTRKADRSTRGS